MRRNQFTVNAESVQGNAGATVTFRCVRVREMNAWRDDPEQNDSTMLQTHVVDWGGFEDDDGTALPSPAAYPEVLGELLLHEQRALVEMLLRGPDGPQAKN